MTSDQLAKFLLPGYRVIKLTSNPRIITNQQFNHRTIDSNFLNFRQNFFNLSIKELRTTLTELMAIAPPAIMGLSSHPVQG